MDQSTNERAYVPKALSFTVPSCPDLSKSGVWVESENFYGGKSGGDAFLVVGFDTEFKTPDDPLSAADINDGLGKYEVLSYQFHCKLYDDYQPDAQEWGDICYPPSKGERLSFGELMAQAFSAGIARKCLDKIPTKVYLVGHFTRADVPAFSDFEEITHLVSAVRNTFLSVDDDIPLNLSFGQGDIVKIHVRLRDTMLLTPAASKGLSAIGELVGVPKLTLDPDPEKDQWYKKNMDVLLRDNPALFEAYAMNDAVICVRYADEIITECQELLGSRKIPATLTGIGVDLLVDAWEAEVGGDWLALLGMEEVKERVWSKKKGRYTTEKKTIAFKEVDWHLNLASEAYHGGRNEQFWFGPAFQDIWTDYDLVGAYPTAMALIQKADWRRIRVTTQVEDFTERTLGVADVTFEFPRSVRFPTMPVRTANGLVFPRRGVTSCGAPEIALAVSLGAKVTINHGVVVPYMDKSTVFGPFISNCVRKRGEYVGGTLRNLFWKELTNSSYGKTAQGLRKKRVFDLKSRETKPLPPSKITNAFFAAYITSFVRAVLGEIMNALPASVCVFSCTTDGFLTNARPDDMTQAIQGPLCRLYKDSRLTLTGKETLYETKHECRQPLGWRTRGQATLIPGASPKGEDYNYVLAKGGIYTKSHLDSVVLRNNHITQLFFGRYPEQTIPMEILTGIRDMVERGTDLVMKLRNRRLSMEFDWKRRPYAVATSDTYGHVAFSTTPWESVEEFDAIRGYWDELTSRSPLCVKSMGDYHLFATHVFSKSILGHKDATYLRGKDPDTKRLRLVLCRAWQQSKAGLVLRQDGMSNEGFAKALTAAGLPTTRTNVEAGSKPKFAPNKCPPTPTVLSALRRLKLQFPSLDEGALLASSGAEIDLLAAASTPCQFIDRLNVVDPDRQAA